MEANNTGKKIPLSRSMRFRKAFHVAFFPLLVCNLELNLETVHAIVIITRHYKKILDPYQFFTWNFPLEETRII